MMRIPRVENVSGSSAFGTKGVAIASNAKTHGFVNHSLEMLLYHSRTVNAFRGHRKGWAIDLETTTLRSV